MKGFSSSSHRSRSVPEGPARDLSLLRQLLKILQPRAFQPAAVFLKEITISQSLKFQHSGRAWALLDTETRATPRPPEVLPLLP